MPKIKEMFAFVAENEGPDDEGIIGALVGTVMLPLVGADEATINRLKPIAKRVAEQSGKKIKLLRFTHREDLGDV